MMGDYVGRERGRSFAIFSPVGCVAFVIVGIVAVACITGAMIVSTITHMFDVGAWIESFKKVDVTVGQAVVAKEQLVNKQVYVEQTIVFPLNSRSGSDWPLLKEIFGKDTTTLIYGRVSGGIDYTKHSQDIRWDDNGTLHVTLPAPEVLYADIEYGEGKTQQIDSSGAGIFVDEKVLTNEANIQAQKMLDKAACEGGIIEKARTAAQAAEELHWRRVKDSNPKWGIKEVDVEFDPGSPPGDCSGGPVRSP